MNDSIGKILNENIKSFAIFTAYMIGAFICHTYLTSIDAIEIFTSGTINLFITLSFISSIIFVSIILLFSLPYVETYYLNKQIDNNKIDETTLRIKHHKISRKNISILFIILFGVLFIHSFYSLDDEFKSDSQYLSIQPFIEPSLRIITLSAIYAIHINIEHYKFIHKNSKGPNSRLFTIFNYLIYLVGTPNLFIIVWFILSTFFGLDSPNEVYEFYIFIIFFFIISTVYALIPIEKKEITNKEKTYKTVFMSLICFILMTLCSYIFNTNFSYNLMKVIGKADKRNHPYIIHNTEKYNLPYKDSDVICGRVLWRDEHIIIFLPKGYIEKKNRFMIDKKDIYPLQGKERLTYCNK